MTRGPLLFVVESGTDVRLIDGLSERFDLTVLGRPIPGGKIISQSSESKFELVTGPGGRIAFGEFVRSYLWSHRIRVPVLVQGYGIAALATNIAAKRFRTRSVMLVCSPVEEYYKQRQMHPQAGKRFRPLELLGLRVAARMNARVGQHYCVLSEYLGETVRKHGGRLPISVIPVYGVDTTRFRPASLPRTALREMAGIRGNDPVIFFSSRVAPEKDSETLIEAVRKLRDAGRVVTILHRSGGFRDFLALAAKVGLQDQVIATDAVRPGPDLVRDYQASDLCIQASRAEGLGFSVLEAMACETPVIASAVGGLTETVIDGVTGFTYPVGDSGTLAKRISDCLDNPEESTETARKGRQLVVEQFDSFKVFNRLEALISEKGTANSPGVTPE